MKIKKLLYGYLIFSLMSGLGLAVWRTILLYRYYDPYNDKFSLDAEMPLATFGYVMAICVALALTSAIVLYKREWEPFSTSAHQFSVFSSSLCGFLCFASGVLALVYYGKDAFTSGGNPFYRAFLIVALVALLPSALYFLMNSSAKYDGRRLRTVLSVFPMLFATAFLGAAYLAPDFVFSDSNDLLRNVALCGMVLFWSHEGRTAVYGKSFPARFVFAQTLIIAVLAYHLPSLIVTAFWEMELSYMTMMELTLCGALIHAVSTSRAMIIHLAPKVIATNEEATITAET